MDFAEHGPENMNEEVVEVKDLARFKNIRLAQYGFERVNLSEALHPLFQRIGEKGILDALRVGPTTEQLDGEPSDEEMP